MASASNHLGIPLLFRYPGAKGRAVEAYGATYKAQAEGVDHLVVPFAGSLVEPLWLISQGYLGWGTLTINDANLYVANLWRAVVTDGETLAELTEATFREWNGHDPAERKDAFKALRAQVNQTGFGPQPTAGLYGSTLQAARFLLFQALGFNGLFRVNGSGGINVPPGTPCDEDATPRNVEAHVGSVRAASELLGRLRQVNVTCLDWRDALAFDPRAEASRTLTIADPPYHNTHSAYTAEGFPNGDHVDLVAELEEAPSRVIVTNSPSARGLFDPERWEISEHEIRRSIAPKSKGRGGASEIMAVKRMARE